MDDHLTGFTDTPERPHYFGWRELLAKHEEWQQHSPHMLGLAMGQHKRLGQDAPDMRDISHDIFRMIHSSLIVPAPYTYLVPHTEGNAIPHELLPNYGEFLRVIPSAGWWQSGGWNVRILQLSLNAIIYDGPLLFGIQYVSPVAVGSHARLEIQIAPSHPPSAENIWLRGWRVGKTGDIERELVHNQYRRGTQTHVIAELEDELDVILRPIDHMLPSP